MNVRLEFNTHILAGVYWDNKVLFNDYFVRCDMITGTKDNVEQNIALERTKHILFNRMTNSVFIDSREKAAIKKLEAAGVKTAILPEQPVDQIIGMMLFSKLDAVMEGRIIITQLKLSSEIGDSITYCQNDQESIGPFANKGWWNNPEPICSDSRSSSGKVVPINPGDTWQSLDLHWLQGDSVDTASNVLTFRKDDKE